MNIVQDKELEKFGRFTIGTTTRFRLSSTGREIEYIFYVNGLEYIGVSGHFYDAKIGEKFIVKFSSKDPSKNEIYLNKPAPLEIPPSEGWAKRPW